MINTVFKIILCYLDISPLWIKFSSNPSTKHWKPVLALSMSQRNLQLLRQTWAGVAMLVYDQQSHGALPLPRKYWVFPYQTVLDI